MADVSDGEPAGKRFRLLAADGSTYESEQPGTLGGNRAQRIYGRLDCSSAIRALPRGYAKHRVFFADEAAAIAAGYRPCGNCMRERYRIWKDGGVVGSPGYPWLILPDKKDSSGEPGSATGQQGDAL